MDILKGAPTVQAMFDKMQLKLMHLEGYQPHLAIIRVGEKPDDIAYERGAKSRMEKTGLRCSCYEFPADISMEEFEQSFDFINNDDDIDGILLLRPLPKHLDEAKIVNKIDPEKDMDGISPVNMAKVFMGDKTGYAPCTAQAVIELLDQEGINVSGKRVAVIGRSLVVGRPLAMLLMHKNATVTICHTKTQNAEAICRGCDIVIAAAGCAKMVGTAYLGNDTTVIDVGINVDGNGKLCGDVDFEAIKDIAKAATPVPGGVGSVTTSVLAAHTIRAALKKRGLED